MIKTRIVIMMELETPAEWLLPLFEDLGNDKNTRDSVRIIISKRMDEYDELMTISPAEDFPGLKHIYIESKESTILKDALIGRDIEFRAFPMDTKSLISMRNYITD